jgi:transposase-like protein
VLQSALKISAAEMGELCPVCFAKGRMTRLGDFVDGVGHFVCPVCRRKVIITKTELTNWDLEQRTDETVLYAEPRERLEIGQGG